MRRCPVLCVCLCLVSSCQDGGAPPNTGASGATTASAPSFTRPEGSATASAAAPAASAEEAPPAEPSGSASSAPDATSSSSAVAPVTMPEVEVKNVGMHIGGGPNDAATKRPIRAAVQPHYDALKLCYARAKDPDKQETFGVDILIPREGGKAKITKPRTALKGEGVKDCMVKVFEGVVFAKPASRAPTMVSFSVRLTKKAISH